MATKKIDQNNRIKLNNGVEIPQVGLGVFQVEPGQQTEQVVRWGIEAGYRHIDTAQAYNNEESVGQAILSSGLARDEIFVTTKLWNEDIRKGNTVQACEGSLKRLQMDYIDLYLIHWPAEGFEEAWLEMEKLYQAGKVRSVGVSNFQKHHLEKIKAVSPLLPAVNQIECHPLLTQVELREYCQGLGIAIEAWSPLGGTGGNLLQNSQINKIAEKYKKTPAAVVLRWDLQSNMITLPKSVNKDRIIANLDIFDFELSSADMELINNLNQNKRVGADPDNFNF